MKTTSTKQRKPKAKINKNLLSSSDSHSEREKLASEMHAHSQESKFNHYNIATGMPETTGAKHPKPGKNFFNVYMNSQSKTPSSVIKPKKRK